MKRILPSPKREKRAAATAAAAALKQQQQQQPPPLPLPDQQRTIEERTIELSTLEARRDEKRRRFEALSDRSIAIKREMDEIEAELMTLDEDIGDMERQIRKDHSDTLQQQQQQQQQPTHNPYNNKSSSSSNKVKSESNRVSESPPIVPSQSRRDGGGFSPTQRDDILTDPLTMNPRDDDDDEDDDDNLPDPLTQQVSGGVKHNNNQKQPPPAAGTSRPPSRSGNNNIGTSVGQLELKPAAAVASKKRSRCRDDENKNSSNEPPTTTTHNNNRQKQPPPQPAKPSGTLDQYFLTSSSSNRQQQQHQPAAAAAPLDLVASASSSVARQRPPPAQQQQQQQRSSSLLFNDPSLARFGNDNFPWSRQVLNLLRTTFQIQSFRNNQKEIINATLERNDVFVIMRTGGGKSLTYQLPALLEGRRGHEYDDSSSRKVTFVISPLLSLIQDQEDQMNSFVPGSAVSFTSGLTGGNAEHARRWALVRDPNQGVCLVFVTPEKVNKSNKLRNEMQKLYDQNRLGRFVIDEAHCASNWGHDFRPDYAQLGVLKTHFPSIPLIAVTATASDKVKNDVCQILRLGTNYKFFRSTANRPNLRYSVRPKKDGKKDIVTDMAAFIKEHHPRDAGIVYTFSRKDADTVADALCEVGIIARSYHSSITPAQKDLIHRSWMRNETQVVVATIAFGLGINKPDVRFVLHHTISKTLDAYYQESGRAGRDGNAANCVLYYSPKDVPRMIKMVHGSNGADLLLPMVRYGQASGNDEVCKATILAHLGEPIVGDLEALSKKFDGVVTEYREVGRQAQNAVRLLSEHHSDLTMSQLVKEWRSKSDATPQYVKDNPPSKDGLTVEDCERIIVSLLVESVLVPKVVWTAYDSIAYLNLGSQAHALIRSPDPKIYIRFPKREEKKPAAAAAKKKATAQKARKSVPDNDGEWLSTKPKAKSKKTTATRKRKKKASTAATKRKTTKKKRTTAKKKRSTSSSGEVVDLCTDDDDDDTDDDIETVDHPEPSAARAKRSRRSNKQQQQRRRGAVAAASADSDSDVLWDDGEESTESEFEFDT